MNLNALVKLAAAAGAAVGGAAIANSAIARFLPGFSRAGGTSTRNLLRITARSPGQWTRLMYMMPVSQR